MAIIAENFSEQVIKLLRTGGMGFMPTDTIYGLSCLALDEQAVERLRQIKGRSENKPFIILFASMDMLRDLKVDEAQIEHVRQYWPGSLTLICRAVDSPGWLRLGHQSLALRFPADEQLAHLIRKTGPLISTSANPEGRPPANSVKEAMDYFGNQLDFYVHAGDMSGRQPSTMARLKDGKLEVVRRGAVKIN